MNDFPSALYEPRQFAEYRSIRRLVYCSCTVQYSTVQYGTVLYLGLGLYN